MKALRQTVDLSAYPDLVVVYLGMTVNMLTGIKTLLGFGPKIEGSVAARPDGLLLHENTFFSLFPLHVGMRQYWRDFESLERFTRADPHREWWKQFLRDTGGTGFWHELYSVRGGFESIYVDVQRPIGFLSFAKATPAKGGLFSARGRLHRGRNGGHTRAVYGNRAVGLGTDRFSHHGARTKALLTDCPRRAQQQLSKRAGAEYARRFATSVQYHAAAAL
jgi:hypothetical protein